ncbi:hypothetical protein RJ640_018875 [Escallonia rubra]|uniref:Uncharacterized protein n=1 Tax=Escallonia rubra TaxID=112253 RepID=A0AA88UNZ9_9ASTE|nr:hypothetical protein RJ640_018875 [Escallonia rubra]
MIIPVQFADLHSSRGGFQGVDGEGEEVKAVTGGGVTNLVHDLGYRHELAGGAGELLAALYDGVGVHHRHHYALRRLAAPDEDSLGGSGGCGGGGSGGRVDFMHNVHVTEDHEHYMPQGIPTRSNCRLANWVLVGCEVEVIDSITALISGQAGGEVIVAFFRLPDLLNRHLLDLFLDPEYDEPLSKARGAMMTLYLAEEATCVPRIMTESKTS